MLRRSHSTPRGPLTLFAVVAALGALAVAWCGRRPPDYGWRGSQPCAQDGTNTLRLNGEYDGLRLLAAYPPHQSMGVLSGPQGNSPAVVLSHSVAQTPTTRRIHTTVVDMSSGDTLALWADRWLVCPLDPDSSDGDILLWHPEADYVRTRSRATFDTVALFRHNYALDYKLMNTSKFTSSLEAAARGESLAVTSRLLVTGVDGNEQGVITFDPRYTADSGHLYETSRGPLGLVTTDGGYANSDLFHLLLDQPRLIDGEPITVASADDIEGSYGGFFCVAPQAEECLWYRRLGLSGVTYRAVDLDCDGCDEILVETYCAENGVSGGGTTDAGTAYLLCVDQGGNIIWRKRVLGFHLGVQAAAVDITGGENLEVVMVWSSGFYEETGGVAILAADGRTLVERTDLGGLYTLAIADFDADGAMEIATSGPEGRIYLLDSSLDVKHTRVDSTDLLAPAGSPSGQSMPRRFCDSGVIWRRRVVPLAATDVNGDGIPELIALHTAWHRWDMPGVSTIMCGRGDIVVLDGGLNEITRVEIDHRTAGVRLPPGDHPASLKLRSFAVDIDADGVDELMIASRSRGLFACGTASSDWGGVWQATD